MVVSITSGEQACGIRNGMGQLSMASGDDSKLAILVGKVEKTDKLKSTGKSSQIVEPPKHKFWINPKERNWNENKSSESLSAYTS